MSTNATNFFPSAPAENDGKRYNISKKLHHILRNDEIKFKDVRNDADFKFITEVDEKKNTSSFPWYEPNAENDEDIRQYVNGDRQDKKLKHMGIYISSLTGVLGLYYLNKLKLIDQDFIGVSDDNGELKVLLPGYHCLASPLHGFEQTFNIGLDLIQFKTLTIVRIFDDELGLAINDGKPEILKPGRHIRNSNRFKFERRVKSTEAEIRFNTVTIFRVFEDEVALAWQGEKAVVFQTGYYAKNDPFFKLVKRVKIKDPVIQFGPVCIFRVMDAHLGLGWYKDEPQIFKPGIYHKNSPDFVFDKVVKESEPHIQFGPINIITVDAGETRVCYDNGELVLLKEGRYYRDSGTFNVGHTINLRQQTLNFEKHRVLAQGGVYMIVEGLLTFQINDVVKFILELGDRDLIRAIKDVTKAEIANIFSGIYLEQVNPSAQFSVLEKEGKEPTRKQEYGLLAQKSDVKKEIEPGHTESEFRNQIIEDITRNISKVIAGWGINVIAFQLKSIELANAAYAEEYEKASLELATAEVERRAIDAKKEIKVEKAQADAEAALCIAKGKGAEMEAIATAERNVAIIKSNTKRDTLTIEAKAEADALRIKAEAANNAAEIMKDPFAKQLRLMPEYQKLLQAHPHRNALIVSGDSNSSSSKGGNGNNNNDLMQSLMTFSILKDLNQGQKNGNLIDNIVGKKQKKHESKVIVDVDDLERKY